MCKAREVRLSLPELNLTSLKVTQSICLLYFKFSKTCQLIFEDWKIFTGSGKLVVAPFLPSLSVRFRIDLILVFATKANRFCHRRESVSCDNGLLIFNLENKFLSFFDLRVGHGSPIRTVLRGRGQCFCDDSNLALLIEIVTTR